MDFVAICIAILLWLVRPQDWLAGFAGFGFMRYTMMAAILGLYTRPGGLYRKMFFRSPADYLIVAYLLWIVYTTGDYYNTAKQVFPFLVFYYAAALALDTPKKLNIFLGCWVVGLIVVAVFGLSTELGFELAPGSSFLTNSFEGRLALNTWIFNNPNSLGHGVVLLITMSYVWFWWKRPLLLRLLAIICAVIAGLCVFYTESKGAYLVGAATFGLVFLFRKKLILQAVVLSLALTSGVAAIKLLPRMDTLSSQEDGIAGRLIIWQMAHTAMINTDTGEGWKKFEAWITIPKMGTIRKATHGSYVNVGADLGYPGLLLFVTILYCNARVVLQARPHEDDEISNRNHRALLTLTTAYSISAWILDRAYHTDFFLIAGAISAFHRQMTNQVSPEGIEEAGDNEFISDREVPVALGRPIAAGAGGFQSAPTVFASSINSGWVESSQSLGSTSLSDDESSVGQPKPPLTWRRFTWLDGILIFAAFYAVLSIWRKVMTSFIPF